MAYLNWEDLTCPFNKEEWQKHVNGKFTFYFFYVTSLPVRTLQYIISQVPAVSGHIFVDTVEIMMDHNDDLLQKKTVMLSLFSKVPNGWHVVRIQGTHKNINF